MIAPFFIYGGYIGFDNALAALWLAVNNNEYMSQVIAAEQLKHI